MLARDCEREEALDLHVLIVVRLRIRFTSFADRISVGSEEAFKAHPLSTASKNAR